MTEIDYDPDEWPEEEYPESGPFCRHWGDPGDCDEKCATCGHEHSGLGESCSVDGCSCDEFKDTK